MNNTTKINILAYASEPDKNYDYDGDFVEYNGKVYWVCLRDELVEFVRNAKKKEGKVSMDGINNLVYKAETQDEFIFRTLSDFGAREYQIVVGKEELAKAIQLIRMYREYGRDIDQCWSTATQQSAFLSDAYRRGYQKGRDDEHNRVMNILNTKRGEE